MPLQALGNIRGPQGQPGQPGQPGALSDVGLTSTAVPIVAWNGSEFTSAGWPLLAPNGSGAAPSYSFANSPGTGMYAGTNQLLWTAGGVGRWWIGSNGYLQAFVDNTYDIGTGTNYRPRNVFAAGEIRMSSIRMIIPPSPPYTYLYNTAAFLVPYFTQPAGTVRVVDARVVLDGGMGHVNTADVYRADSPICNGTSSIGTMVGLRVVNQGGSPGEANRQEAIGIYIEQQQRATSRNVGLYSESDIETGGDLTAYGGALYLHDSAHWLWWNAPGGAYVLAPGSLQMTGDLTLYGTAALNASSATFGGNISTGGNVTAGWHLISVFDVTCGRTLAVAGSANIVGNLTVQTGGIAAQAGLNSYTNGGVTTWGVYVTDAANYTGQGIANAWPIHSIRTNKRNIEPLHNALDIVRNPSLNGVSYDTVVTERMPTVIHTLGFVADDWEPVVPAVVAHGPKGEIAGMDYDRVGAITFQALKELAAQVEGFTARLEKLEGSAA